MKADGRSSSPTTTGQEQSGIALIVVMVALVLSTLLAMSSARMAWLNERMASSQSDHLRAFAAAEALMKDAENDIRGERVDGEPCSTDPQDLGCRGPFAEGRPFFPADLNDLDTLSLRIGGELECLQGICLPTSLTSLSPKSFTTRLLQTSAAPPDKALAATYGQFTATSTESGNPLLSGSSAKAWYWVEVFQHDVASAIATPVWRHPTPDVTHPFIYRINAFVQGHKPGTRVWLRSLYMPQAQQAQE
jgi:type IV pilus assembly protein PilX